MLNENISRTEEWRKKKTWKSWESIRIPEHLISSLWCSILYFAWYQILLLNHDLLLKKEKKIISMKIWPNIVIRAKVKLKWANTLWDNIYYLLLTPCRPCWWGLCLVDLRRHKKAELEDEGEGRSTSSNWPRAHWKLRSALLVYSKTRSCISGQSFLIE